MQWLSNATRRDTEYDGKKMTARTRRMDAGTHPAVSARWLKEGILSMGPRNNARDKEIEIRIAQCTISLRGVQKYLRRIIRKRSRAAEVTRNSQPNVSQTEV